MSHLHSNDNRTKQQPSDDSVWELIADKVDQLVAAWENTKPDDEPDLRDFVTDVADNDKKLMLCELIKADLECRWQDQRAPQLLEFYIQLFPDWISTSTIPAELIYEEIQIRMHAGQNVDHAELCERFPDLVDELSAYIGTIQIATTNDPLQTVSVIPSEIRTASLETLDVGQSIDDFDLLLMLGQGSFAKVFLARQRSLERLVALKVSQDKGVEPRTMAQMEHPNVVRVFDQRTVASPPVRLLYMELVPGGTIQDIIQAFAAAHPNDRNGQLILDTVDMHLSSSGTAPPVGSSIRKSLIAADWSSAVCQIGYQLADGLAFAHAKGVLHRDIKPANILLSPEASPKLADFNVSFQGGREDENPEDAFGGSLGYMAPEQLEACDPALGGNPQAVHASSDIYAVGVVLFEMSCGERPFDDPETNGSWSSALQRMADSRRAFDWARWETKLVHCSEPLRAVLKRCLNPATEKRFLSAQHLSDALQLCLNPRCWKLLQPPQTWTWRLPLSYPGTMVLLATLLPSTLAAVFNSMYNERFIVDKLDGAASVFNIVRIVINGIAFPLGISYVIFKAHQCAKRIREPTVENPEIGGAEPMFLGRSMASIPLTLWLMAGISYPLAIHWSGVSMSANDYLHFVISLALCGILSGTYPFFLVTCLGVRSFLPEMIRRQSIRGPSIHDINELRKINRNYVTLTAGVPMLGILLMILLSGDSDAGFREFRPYLVVSSVVGIVGFFVMFLLYRFIDDDLGALQSISPDASAFDVSNVRTK